MADMATVRRFCVLAIFVAASLEQGNCKAESSKFDDIKLYYGGDQKTNDVTENNFLGDQKIANAGETNGRENQKRPDADTETYVNADIEGDYMKSSILGNTNTASMDPFEEGNYKLLHVPWWPSFLSAFINKLNHQYIQDKYQSSFLYMGRTYIPHQNQFPLRFHPRNQDGTPVINNQMPLSPPSRREYVNYVAARPHNVHRTMIEAERDILDEMDSLWSSYNIYHSNPPNMIVLYSWMMPSPKSTELIIKHFNQALFATVPYKIVAYTIEGTNLAYMTRVGNRNSRQRLNNNNISYWKQQCEAPDSMEHSDVEKTETYSAENHVCKLSDSFQGCFVECLGRDFCCSCKESRKTAMNVAMVNDLTKDCATSDIKTCARSWIQKAFSGHLSGASPCTDIESTRAKFLSCVDTCVGHLLSKPLDPFNPFSYPGCLEDFSNIFKYPSVKVNDFCSDVRAEGYLCYNYRADSFTAGNSLCKTGSVCDYKGESYKWCYTEYGGRDYCCTSTCSYGDHNYMSCRSGNESQLCGSPGKITMQGRHCLAGYPCGMHQEEGQLAYYWCYTDTNKYWGYCCQPGDTCSKKGENYNWCYTGYEKKTGKRQCVSHTF